MLISMTGFGKAETSINAQNLSVEIRCLNSKQCDVNLKLPNIYKEKEIELRNEISNRLQRGKIDVIVKIENSDKSKALTINTTVITNYFEQMKNLAHNLNIEINEAKIFESIVLMPEVFSQQNEEVEENQWSTFFKTAHEAMDNVEKFRIQEGTALENDIRKRIQIVVENNFEIEKFEAERLIAIRNRLDNSFSELDKRMEIDRNRFEQELIYYLERLDITEERVRLRNHCTYFIETIEKEQNQAKKLNFIAQEMGREINTLGSKAQHSEIQKLVIQMKDELEKIKEQLMNVL